MQPYTADVTYIRRRKLFKSVSSVSVALVVSESLANVLYINITGCNFSAATWSAHNHYAVSAQSGLGETNKWLLLNNKHCEQQGQITEYHWAFLILLQHLNLFRFFDILFLKQSAKEW